VSGSDGDDCLLEVDPLVTTVGRTDVGRLRPREPGDPIQNGRAGRLEERRYALPLAADDLFLPLHRLSEVEPALRRDHANVRTLGPEGFVEQGRMDQRLGGDAPPVEALAAEVLTFDNEGFATELSQSDCRHVPAWATADDQDLGSSRVRPCHRRVTHLSARDTGYEPEA